MNGPIDGLVRGAARRVGISLALSWISDAAEGKRGDTAKRIYWRLAGGKAYVGLLISIVAIAAAAVGQMEIAAGAGTVGGALVSVGLIDKGWRNALPSGLVANPIFRLLGRRAADVSVVLGVCYYFVSTNECGVWCDRAELALIALGAVLVQLGLMKSASDAPGPKLPPPKMTVDRDEFLRP